MATVGDYSLLGELYGLTPEQIKKLQNGGITYTGSGGGGGDDGYGGMTEEELMQLILDMQKKGTGSNPVLDKKIKENTMQDGTPVDETKYQPTIQDEIWYRHS